MKKSFFFITIVFFIVGCKTTVERGSFNNYEPVENSWDEVFNNSRDLTVEVWNTGTFDLEYDGVLNVKSEKANDLKGKIKTMDIPVFYVDNGEFRYLIDTGINKNFMDDKLKYVRGLAAPFVLSDINQGIGDSVVERLEHRDIKLDYIFLTHMHFDHIAGLADLNPDYPVIIGKNEEQVQYNLFFVTDYMKGVKDLRELEYSKSKKFYPFENVTDVFGDSSLYAINTGGGHSHGHTLYLINGKDQKYLVTGDQINIKENIDRGVGPGNFSTDVEVAQKNFDKIMEFIHLYPQVKLLLGHEITKEEL